MMSDLLKIQSESDRRPQQMKPAHQKSENLEEESGLGVIEPNPFLASPRLFGPKSVSYTHLTLPTILRV